MENSKQMPIIVDPDGGKILSVVGGNRKLLFSNNVPTSSTTGIDTRPNLYPSLCQRVINTFGNLSMTR